MRKPRPGNHGHTLVAVPEDEPAYLVANRANWDDRALVHVTAPDYEVQAFIDDPEHLSGVVRFDRPRLGDVAGLTGVHLQCHIGTDTLSVARLGARMTGLDFSPGSIAQARMLAEAVGADIDYVVSDVYAAPEALGGRTFDLVYVSVGAISWLPSVGRWAEVVDRVLKPGGRLFIRDTHPMLDTLEPDVQTGKPVPSWPYFESGGPVIWDEDVTYVAPAPDSDAAITHREVHTWSHGIGETVTALLDRGLVLTRLEEHQSAPFCPFPGLMERDEIGEWTLVEHPERIPMTFTLQAVKPG